VEGSAHVHAVHPVLRYQKEPARDVRQRGAHTARRFLPEDMLILARLRTDAVCDHCESLMPADIPTKSTDKSNMHAASSTFCILTAAWEGKSWNFRLQKITDRSHVDGPASTTNNSLCAWLAIVSARSKGSPRQKTPTQSRS
jgi:hypothetical protein